MPKGTRSPKSSVHRDGRCDQALRCRRRASVAPQARVELFIRARPFGTLFDKASLPQMASLRFRHAGDSVPFSQSQTAQRVRARHRNVVRQFVERSDRRALFDEGAHALAQGHFEPARLFDLGESEGTQLLFDPFAVVGDE